PAWTGHKASNGKAGGMMAYYHMVLPAARLPLLQATVVDGVLHVLLGDPRLNGQTVAIAGAQALDMQANSIGLYWDESADLHGTALETMKTTLTSLAQQMQP
ncbi:MAG: hypothetical protein RL180_493, partial [Pseudomonadota bacterium]